MKKALVIFLALAMVCSVFAAEPAAEVKVAEFKGSAAVTFGINLDTVKTGFKNETDGSLKLNFMNGGEKSTTGSGIWGELKIKIVGLQASVTVDDNFALTMQKDNDNASDIRVEIDTAKIHFGPVYMGIKSGNLSYGGSFWYPHALNYKDSNDKYNRTPSDKFETTGTNVAYDQGIVVGYANDKFKVEGSLRSNKEKDGAGKPIYWTNKYAMGVYGEATPIKDLRAGAGFAYVLGNISLNTPISDAQKDADRAGDFSLFAGVDYRFNFNDDFFIQPTLTYTLTNDYNWVASTSAVSMNALSTGVRLGFAKSKSSSDNSVLYDFFGNKLVYETKQNDKGDDTLLPGVSVYTSFDLKKNAMKTNLPLMVTAYSGEIVNGLKAAALFYANLGKDASKVPSVLGIDYTTLIAAKGLQAGLAASYDIKVNDITVVPVAGFLWTHGSAKVDKDNVINADEFAIEAKVIVKGLIDNTTLTLFWDDAAFGVAKAKILGTSGSTKYTTKGLVGLKAKIAL
ncbi:autotransporter outer membrane beta-barrel domain-containing protein [Treponema sp. OMZ 840]|uniref:autotransporter outer membrane beta-barrel domain-containing protein n=1 Tax=Treponema sp. OMZ 840 TaxID=244313 RepID=UPI003D92AB6D